MENIMGDKIPPWSTPLDIVKQADVSLPHCIQISCLLYQNISICVSITEIDCLSNILNNTQDTDLTN